MALAESLSRWLSLPACVVCGAPCDHGCNTAACSLECEEAGLVASGEMEEGAEACLSEAEVRATRMRRPAEDALLLAAEWCDEYEGEPEHGRLAPVVAWLKDQAAEERKAQFVRFAMSETGCSRARAHAEWRKLTNPPVGTFHERDEVIRNYFTGRSK